MKENKLYAGQDLALCGYVEFGEDESASQLQEFDMDIVLSTTPMGDRIDCSTWREGTETILLRGENGFGVNLGGEITRRMTEGEIEITLLMKHKQTGLVSIAEEKTGKMIIEPKIRY